MVLISITRSGAERRGRRGQPQRQDARTRGDSFFASACLVMWAMMLDTFPTPQFSDHCPLGGRGGRLATSRQRFEGSFDDEDDVQCRPTSNPLRDRMNAALASDPASDPDSGSGSESDSDPDPDA